MTALTRAVFICLVLLLPWRAYAGEPGDTIRSVIENQLSAFQANDVDTAFGFASPSIQQKFGSPEIFGRMVEQGYPMVWRPARHEMGELLETQAGLVQLVVFEDAAGRVYEAGYLMQEVDGVWRINGVHVRTMPAVGA